jgi:hypothetical protein
MEPKTGYKSPHDIVDPKVHQALATYFPNTRLIVGVRHPIHWFESFYNYRIREGHTLPAIPDLIGKCEVRSKGICTAAALFHVHLSFLGKTPFRVGNGSGDEVGIVPNNISSAEANLLSARQRKGAGLPRLPNPIFLYDMQQLADTKNIKSNDYGYDNDSSSDTNRQRRQFATDMTNFLQLQSPLPLIGEAHNTQAEDHSLLDRVLSKSIMDICRPEYDALRAALLQEGTKASIWIREYFLTSPDVTVSSPDYFKELVAQWMVDPCRDPERHKE